jgi:DNA (cytosine-5)-methyltransferase 1
LISPGKVDGRPIQMLEPADVMGYERVHFFAGCAGWELALNLAGWTGPVWSGSAPCQPFSAAGKRKGTEDERHLWPQFFRLISAVRPPVVVGEQVASKDGLAWLDGVQDDFEGSHYAFWAVDLSAAGYGLPHIRQRLYWGAVRLAHSKRPPRCTEHECHQGERAAGEAADRAVPGESGGHGHGLGHTSSQGLPQRGSQRGLQPGTGEPPKGKTTELAGYGLAKSPILLGHSGSHEQIGRQEGRTPDGRTCAFIQCRDGKTRRISAQPGDEPLAYALPLKLGPLLPRLEELAGGTAGAKRLAREFRRNRTGRLKAYGNSLAIPCAAAFLKALSMTLSHQ